MNLSVSDRLRQVLEAQGPPSLICFTSPVFHFFLDRELAGAARYGQYCELSIKATPQMPILHLRMPLVTFSFMGIGEIPFIGGE